MVHGDPTWEHPILFSSVASSGSPPQRKGLTIGMTLVPMAQILGIGTDEEDGVAA